MIRTISTPVLTLATGLLLLLNTATVAAADCPEEAASDFSRGQAAMDEGSFVQAVEYFSAASLNCDTPSYWQALGDANRARMEAVGLADGQEFSQSALEAYGKAFAAARGEKDDAAGARAARAIVDLGLLSGDPLKSQNWLLVATRLEPDHPDIPALETRLDEARGQLSTDEIDTGLSQTRGIGLVNNLLGGSVTSRAFWDADDESAGGAGGSSAAAAGDSGAPQSGQRESTVNIPIRFQSNSTEPTPETTINVSNLAKVLTAKPPATRVILTGHADVRGDDQYNLELSLARAEKIRDLLLEQEPSLEGRIDAHGDGEMRPVDDGDTSRSHANNRRLEVTIIEPALVPD